MAGSATPFRLARGCPPVSLSACHGSQEWSYPAIRTTLRNGAIPATGVPDRYAWDVRYIDAPVCRDEDKNSDGDCIDPKTDPDPAENEGDEHLYYCQDANFNTTALVDGYDGAVVERYMYDPYGKVSVRHGVRDSGGYDTSESEWDERTSNTFDNEILYCGYRFDSETGLYHVRYRYYHVTVGRWLSRDPAGFADGANAYAYGACAPVGALDPEGLLVILPPPGLVGDFILAHSSFCRLLEKQIKSYLSTSWGRMAWGNFVSGSRKDIYLAGSAMEDALDASPKYAAWLEKKEQRCFSGMEWPQSKEKLEDSLKNPWHEAIGRVTLHLTSECKGCCLTWTVAINEYYDFNWKSRGKRAPKTERNVRMVRTAQLVFQCGWKEFYHRGFFVKTSGLGCGNPAHGI